MLSPVESPRELARTLRPQPRGLPISTPDPSRVAVLLNRNARRVNDSVYRQLARIAGTDNVFYSRSLDQAEAFAREIVQRGYGTVVCGGGDGTFVQTINMVQRYIDEANAWRLQRSRRFGEPQSLIGQPRFAFLRLGTGNAIGRLVGAGSAKDDLQRIVDYWPAKTQSIPLVQQDNERFFFAGMGYDSQLLNDYNWLKARTHNRVMKPIMHSVAGYFVALFARTLPQVVFGGQANVDVRVVTRGPAYYVDPTRGDFSEPIEPGTVLFEGKSNFVGCASTPYYGYGFRIFPFARVMPDRMHLRVARIGAFHTLANLPGLWNGTYRDGKRMFDFLVTDVKVELAKPMPFQHSGEACGDRDTLDFRLTDEPLQLVDLHRARQHG
jgi:diacylglycerol kinase family enzyme